VANEVGKRYVCAKCGAEFMVTKAGQGAVSCCGQEMKKK
jgi:DNA-directed RNA polymerase subunit RPC12/RpoP